LLESTKAWNSVYLSVPSVSSVVRKQGMNVGAKGALVRRAVA
jgi:hypothetical protein